MKTEFGNQEIRMPLGRARPPAKRAALMLFRFRRAVTCFAQSHQDLAERAQAVLLQGFYPGSRSCPDNSHKCDSETTEVNCSKLNQIAPAKNLLPLIWQHFCRKRTQRTQRQEVMSFNSFVIFVFFCGEFNFGLGSAALRYP